jgi:hypothetical protein
MLGDPEGDERKRSIDQTKLLLDQLSQEYRILQDKIDKIGAFKFTIRGWSVTIVVASSIGAVTATLPSPFLLLGLIIFVCLFGHMESVQTRHRNTFGRRCAEIERLVWRSLRDQGVQSAGMVPRIAHELEDESRARLRRWKSRRMRSTIKKLRSQEEYAFYSVQIIVIVGLTILLAAYPRKQKYDEPSQFFQLNSVFSEPGDANQGVPPSDSGKNGKNAPRSPRTRK